jgi:hypothetical protein
MRRVVDVEFERQMMAKRRLVPKRASTGSSRAIEGHGVSRARAQPVPGGYWRIWADDARDGRVRLRAKLFLHHGAPEHG